MAQHGEWTAVGLRRSHSTADKMPKQKANKCLMLVILSHAPFQTTQLELKFKSSNKNINVEHMLKKI